MGIAIERSDFSKQEYQIFSERLQNNLTALAQLIDTPGFGEGPASFGAELEMYIVDQAGNPARINEQLIQASQDPQLQMELNQFNLEYNLSPVVAQGAPFSCIEKELQQKLTALESIAKQHHAYIIPIGILPTLIPEDFCSNALSRATRYQALSKGLQKMRDGPFRIDIDGEPPLALTCDDVTLEGANTSFQVHWRVNPADFVDTFNALQLMTPLALAIGANSPTLLGHMLWDETRISLFKQSVDSRDNASISWRMPTRVPFGFGWLRKSPTELFAQTVALFPPLIPVVGNENSEQVLKAGITPQLEELRLHQGTVWPWNRAIFDPVDGGHLRIEMRSLPAGPTPQDMLATSAFLIGLAQYMKSKMDDLIPAMPYQYAEYNFYRAAQKGLDAHLIWPHVKQNQPTEQPVTEIIKAYLPLAREGLAMLEVNALEIKQYLGLIEDRLLSGITGARWQRQVLQRMTKKKNSPEAFVDLLWRYYGEYKSGRAVSEWRML